MNQNQQATSRALALASTPYQQTPGARVNIMDSLKPMPDWTASYAFSLNFKDEEK